MPFPLRYLSPTQLRAYDICPLQYRHRYIEKIRPPYTPASLLGEAVHQSLEENFVQKKRTGHDLTLEEAREVFDEVWEQGMPGSALDGAEAEAFEQRHADGARLLEYYLREAAPAVVPHLVEYRFRFEVPGLPVPVVGTVDLIDHNGVVIDHKTSQRPFDPGYLASDLQLMCYAIGYGTFRAGARLQPGKLPSPYFLPDVRVDVLVTSDPPVLQQLVATYGQDELRGFVERAQDIARGIEAGEHPPFYRLPGRSEEPGVCARCSFATHCDQALVTPELLDADDEDGDGEE